MSALGRWWRRLWDTPKPTVARRDPALRAERREPQIRMGEIGKITPKKRGNAASVFKIPTPPPGVLPKDVSGMATDSAISNLYGFAAGGLISEGLSFLGYPYLAELSLRAEYRRLSEIIAKEMTRAWIKLEATGSADKTARIKALDVALRKYNVQNHFRAIAQNDGFFGKCHLYVDLGTGNNPDELTTPLLLDPAKIAKGSLKRLRVIEPLWTYPDLYDATDPLNENFYRPRQWYVQGKKIHGTRLLTFVGREVPDILKPAFMFGGLSLSQMAQETVENWLRTRQSVSDTIHSFSVSGIKTNLAGVLNGGALDAMLTRIELFNKTRDNRGAMLLDKETEEYFNVTTPLSGLDLLQAQSQEHMASVSGIPIVKLLGIQPAGLNASSQGELETFYDWILAQQEHLFRPHLETIIKIIQLTEFGEIDDGITFKFVPLKQLDEAAKAAIRKTDADTGIELVNANIISPLEERRRIAASEDSPYAGLDVADVPEPPADGEEDDASILPDPATHFETSTTRAAEHEYA